MLLTEFPLYSDVQHTKQGKRHESSHFCGFIWEYQREYPVPLRSNTDNIESKIPVTLNALSPPKPAQPPRWQGSQ